MRKYYTNRDNLKRVLIFLPMTFLLSIATSGASNFEVPVLSLQKPRSQYLVDLNEFPLYARAGFSQDSVWREPSINTPGWTVFPPSPSGRSVRFTDLRYEGQKTRYFLEPQGRELREFTYLIPFTLPKDLPASIIPGLYLASLGDNWEIYLNGSKLRSELHIDRDGRLLSHRNRRDIYFPLDPTLLVNGKNILAIRLAGDPSFQATGMYYTEPYYLAPFQDIQDSMDESLELILCGIYIFVGIYHFFIFLVRRKDRYNLFYGLFALFLGLYLFARTHAIYRFIPDGAIVIHLEFSLLFMILPALSAFVDTISIDRLRPLTWIYGIFGLVLIGLEIFMPLPFGHDLLTLWQGTALFMVAYIFFYAIIWEYLRSVFRTWKWIRTGGNPGPHGKEYLHALTENPLSKLIPGAAILFATAIYDILDAMFFYTDVVLTRYGFFFFTIGTALILANRYNFLYKQLNLSNQNLERRIDDLKTAKAWLERSEKKYRSLFDGTNDPITIVDDQFRFKECNAAAVHFFNLEGVSLEYTNKNTPTLPSRLYKDERELISPTERFDRALAYLQQSGGPLELNEQLRSPIGELKPCNLRMEYIRSGEEPEILVRVAPDKEDILAQAYVEGRERFDIENGLTAADTVCRHACARLSRYIGQEEANFVMVCLREMVLNAIEHGNLEINFQEKTKALRDRSYFDFIQKRKEHDKFKKRTVTVEYSVTSERALFRITDCGKGFDHKKALQSMRQSDQRMLEHGRGLIMTLAAFDRVAYNQKGNQVTLEKNFAK